MINQDMADMICTCCLHDTRLHPLQEWTTVTSDAWATLPHTLHNRQSDFFAIIHRLIYMAYVAERCIANNFMCCYKVSQVCHVPPYEISD